MSFIRVCGLGLGVKFAFIYHELPARTMDLLHVSQEDTQEFLQMWFYGHLNKIFETICAVRELPADVAEELRRIVLQPNAVRVEIKGQAQSSSEV